jgi:hypothetical protein
MRFGRKSLGRRPCDNCFAWLMRTGSHVNATFKGDHSNEFAWFSIGRVPLLSIRAWRAARQIVAAVRRGRPELTIILPARGFILAHTLLLPNFLARIFRLVSSLLPKAIPGQRLVRKKAREPISHSPFSLQHSQTGQLPASTREPQPRR